jgi:NAD(P)-dependent dehydrogenase (short-subunit alcohol dehydrogenase family)
MGALEGKLAVITGDNSGTGLATAKRFVKERLRSRHVFDGAESASTADRQMIDPSSPDRRHGRWD